MKLMFIFFCFSLKTAVNFFDIFPHFFGSVTFSNQSLRRRFPKISAIAPIYGCTCKEKELTNPDGTKFKKMEFSHYAGVSFKKNILKTTKLFKSFAYYKFGYFYSFAKDEKRKHTIFAKLYSLYSFFKIIKIFLGIKINFSHEKTKLPKFHIIIGLCFYNYFDFSLQFSLSKF